MRSTSLRSTCLRHRSAKAFSLLEILTVLALLAVLFGFLIVNFGGIFDQGSSDAARMFVNNSLEAPLLKYKMDTGGYPTTEQGLAALVSKPAGATGRWNGPYLRDKPVDPWKMPYQYRYPGTHNPGSYDLWSWGPNRQEGGGDDIGNWDQ